METSARMVSTAAILVPLYFGLAGTAGMYSPQTIANLADFSPTPIIRVVGQKSQKKHRTAAESLMKMRDIFGLKMSEIAQIFGVSRTAVYDWVSGTTPKADIAVKLDLFGSCADELCEAGISNCSLFLRRPLGAGRTLLDAMKTGQDLQRILPSLKQMAVEEGYSAPQKDEGLSAQEKRIAILLVNL